MESLSLYELNALVRRSLEQCLPDECWVQAELSDVRTNSTGHCYLEFVQKDWIVPAINSVKLNPTGANIPINVDVQSVVINGETWNLGGYLDIGIVDTMKDLMVNFVGAVVFSVIGILYLTHRGKGKLAASLIPQVRDTNSEVSEK